VSAEVTVTHMGEKSKGRLQMWFSPDKAQATGGLVLGFGSGTGRVAASNGFELVEKDGKCYLKITEGKRDPERMPNPRSLPRSDTRSSQRS
jgi:hypothetical protein